MLAIKPLVVDFVDTTMVRHGQDLTIETIVVARDSSLDGITIKDSIKHTGGAKIMAIKKKAGQLETNPPSDTILEHGDEILVIGTQKQLKGIDSLT